ncbi:hydrogenase formation protein HypD [bacterium]|nr:hydrogenase formation protein HypD [bacterium]
MKYVSEFQDRNAVQYLAASIRERVAGKDLTIMEVCGTHTMAIARSGLRELLPDQLTLISGPGCPVCVTDVSYIDRAIALSRMHGTVIATFGDLMRVPGSDSTLEKERANGADIRIVTSAMDALFMAGQKAGQRVIFLGIGFETTIPTVGVVIQSAKSRHIRNFYVLSSHKIMPPAMKALCEGDVRIDGFLCPGHVSTITGPAIYDDIVKQYGKGCVVTGFEPTDILSGILMLSKQILAKTPAVENQYKRAVLPDGNPRAKEVMDEVFESCDTPWRGLGTIPASGLKIRDAYASWDASVQIAVPVKESREPHGCRCGDVLTGRIQPEACPLFGNPCTPDYPAGACMVSSEGTCAAHYKYGFHRK